MEPERIAKKNMKLRIAALRTGTPAHTKTDKRSGEAVSIVVDIRRSTHNAVLCNERRRKYATA